MKMLKMLGLPGHGRWRLPGRGKRLLCAMRRDGFVSVRTYFRFHKPGKQCRYCGSIKCLDGQIGRVEGFRFVESDIATDKD